MTRTTVYLDEGEYRQLKQLARQRKIAPAALIRAAIGDYLCHHGEERPWPRSIGAGDSGLTDLASNDEAYLRGMGEDGLDEK